MASSEALEFCLWIAQCAVELGIGLYVLDLISGIVHMHLDYQEVKDRKLRLHVETNIPNVINFEESDPLFYEATPNDQFLWNFHVHHDAPYPSKDSEWDLVMQIVRPLSLPYLMSVLLCYMGYMHPTFARIWFGALTAGPLMQKTHFGAHVRNHGVLTNKTWGGAIICFLQDTGFLLSPAVHKIHHEEFDCNFCIFNGWANPVVNRLRIFMSWTGVYPLEAPTNMARRERTEEAKKALKNGTLLKNKLGQKLNPITNKPLKY